jgi:hypothetical protein
VYGIEAGTSELARVGVERDRARHAACPEVEPCLRVWREIWTYYRLKPHLPAHARKIVDALASS